MKDRQPDNTETGFKCSRCGGMFGDHGEQVVHCPFCAMICDEAKCRVIQTSNEDY
ncbi:hypothetical protein [Anaerospora sp.]|jgi:uncharacterized C2H2 Zn-finger protein|uniref:hypothetical protein n=1 Tax=Anaerospora sp. TaxID=1960278 RepID=UPI00289A2CBF|nr:hypothetical protein [Anaerospora sp.]